jgi:hypothetical protein
MLPFLLLLASIEPGQPIAAEASWAVAPDDGPRDFLEQMTGKRVDPRSLGTIREGDMVFTGESLARDLLGVMDVPLPSLDHPPTPGVLVLAMDGVTLKPFCPGTQRPTARSTARRWSSKRPTSRRSAATPRRARSCRR